MKRINLILSLSVFLSSSVINMQAQTDAGKLFFNHVFAPSEGYVGKPELPFRKEICLNGQWDFQAAPLPAGYQQGKSPAPELPEPDDEGWDKTKIKIPSPWNINAFANRNLEGPDHRNYPSYPEAWEQVKMAWLKRTVTVPADWRDEKIILHFEAIAGFAEVYVNHQKVAENFDLFLPFDADITAAVKAGETAEIRVGIRSQALFEDRSTLGRRIIPAGSMWGYLVNGIWQDVYLLALPKINISDIYVKPSVSEGMLELDVRLENTTGKTEERTLSGDIREWINHAGTDVLSAPVPNWELAARAALAIPATTLTLTPGITQTTIRIPVNNELAYWTPEHPNLYGLTLCLGKKKNVSDIKYERFGWREWTFRGTKLLLNGEEIQLKGDSWHFMGVPQLTRRYAWAWFIALKDANANAVRFHAQVYPRFYMDVADEMGICVLAETANWASDGGPKLDSPLFWENSKTHLRRMVLRDRNHASVFGWSISNENKPVILHVFNRPEWLPMQKQAWADWLEIVRTNDPTRPWITADGEDDGDGILPATMGHYGDVNSMKHWIEIGKPWGIGEHSMAYYGTPEQVARYNGERAYESQYGRMEGLAYECYDLIAQQRTNGASYVSVFNIAWYALQPLPFGKRDLTAAPSLHDGIHFAAYREGVPGVQPERMGPYCSTFNPGYDPSLPLYRTWPMFDAIKAANAGDAPAWSEWAKMPEKQTYAGHAPQKKYNEILFIGDDASPLKQLMQRHGIVFDGKIRDAGNAVLLIDGNYPLTEKEASSVKSYLSRGADVWLWSPGPSTLETYRDLLPDTLILEKRAASSFIPVRKSWMANMVNSDFYFSEIQNQDASTYGMTGRFVTEGDVLLRACNTNWRAWNKRPEELKTAAVVRSEREAKGADAMFVKYATKGGVFYISTLDNFGGTEKGYRTLDKLIAGAGIPVHGKTLSESLIDARGYVDLNNLFVQNRNNHREYAFWIYSPRPLDNLLIEPDIPKLDIAVTQDDADILLNDKKCESTKALPLKQGWNKVAVLLPNQTVPQKIRFVCENNATFVTQLQTSLQNPDK
ncbi:MAG: glycoside hydrolase family 2 [Tannerella sp.]|jgi:beta-galactosidase|nr:glycoside hydrolase family 2 [Tannerella sp.]